MRPPRRLRYHVDRSVAAERSVALRYAPALFDGWLGVAHLEAATIREGIGLVELGEVEGVGLVLLDETTSMRTGTYKSLDGCVTTAVCLQEGVSRTVFSSGANVGMALTVYGARAGIETFFFCPASTLYKLDGGAFDPPTSHLIAVEGPDARVKEAARRFAEAVAAPLVPSLDGRLAAAGCRGMFVAEQLKEHGRRFSWLSQAVCAGYGPIGLYRVLFELARQGEIAPGAAPRFLGIQQAGLSPIVEAWAAGCSSLAEMPERGWREPAIEPTLYNANPVATYPMLRRLLTSIDGYMTAVTRADFHRYREAFLERIEAAGIALTTVETEDGTEIVERAGVLCGAGTLKAIAEGRIRAGETVLCSLTGGVLPRPPRPVTPEHRISSWSSLDEEVDALADRQRGSTLERVDGAARKLERAHAD